MLIVPGFLVSYATFPGVIVHEFAHEIACRWRGVAVTDVHYFSASGGGQVTHQSPRAFRDVLLISSAPFVVNTVASIGLFIAATVLYYNQSMVAPHLPGDNAQLVVIGLAWVALSVGWHAFPSFTDARNIWRRAVQRWRSSHLALFSLPLVAMFVIANVLKYAWFDALYAVGLGGVGYTIAVLFLVS